jgi:hypothetical protein
MRTSALTWAGAGLLSVALADAVVALVAGQPPLGPRIVRWLFGLAPGIPFWALSAAFLSLLAAPAVGVVALLRDAPVLPAVGRALAMAATLAGWAAAAASDSAFLTTREREAAAPQA